METEEKKILSFEESYDLALKGKEKHLLHFIGTVVNDYLDATIKSLEEREAIKGEMEEYETKLLIVAREGEKNEFNNQWFMNSVVDYLEERVKIKTFSVKKK